MTTQNINMDIKERLKEDLLWLSIYGNNYIHYFKLIYSHPGIDLPINEIVDKMSSFQIQWVLSRTQSAIDKLQE
jgi:hypothetical protein